MNIREYLQHNILLFDGGMGTCFAERSHQMAVSCELASLRQADLIEEIHREYLEAGCRAIKTNTFAANRITFQGDGELVRRTIRAAWEIAGRAAAGYSAWVFADIGPVSRLDEGQDVTEEYRFVADCFLELGARHFLFETNASAEGLAETAAHIREKAPDAFILVSFAVQADGFTREGNGINELFREMKACPDVDALGLNCVCGAAHMRELLAEVDHKEVLLSVMPNAGYPVVINNRTFYEGNPDFFAEQVGRMAAEGAAIVGGCCGTTPAHIRQLKVILSDKIRTAQSEKSAHSNNASAAQTERQADSEEAESVRPERPSAERRPSEKEPRRKSSFWDKLQAGESVIAVELDSPANTELTKFLRGAEELRRAGADILTIADCPVARARMDSSLLACKVRRELQMDVLPHMTCRDRNLNATKALLLGLYAEGVRNVLLVTGDPVPTAERDEVKSVYQFNSRKLASFVSSLGEKVFPAPFHIFGALNLNAPNFDVQLRLAEEKQKNGMTGFLTQPVLTPAAFENLKRAKETLRGYILGGVIPVVSAANARFMDSEINGIRVDPEITALYEGKGRQEAEALAVDISVRIMKDIAPYVDGFYLMTPFGRTGLIARILQAYQNEG